MTSQSSEHKHNYAHGCERVKIVLAATNIVKNASNAITVAVVVGNKPGLAAVGSATVAVLSQSSGVAAISFFP